MRLKKRKTLAVLGRGTIAKAIMIGANSRMAGKVAPPVILYTGGETLQALVDEIAQEGVIVSVSTDEPEGCVGLDRKGRGKHNKVKQSKGDYVKGCAGTNRMGCLCAKFGRACRGTWYHVSNKRLRRCLHEAAARHDRQLYWAPGAGCRVSLPACRSRACVMPI